MLYEEQQKFLVNSILKITNIVKVKKQSIRLGDANLTGLTATNDGPGDESMQIGSHLLLPRKAITTLGWKRIAWTLEHAPLHEPALKR